MRVMLGGILAFLAGFILTYVVAVAAALGYMSINNINDRDGGLSMGIVFLIGPFCALTGGLIAAIVTVIRMNSRRRAAEASELPPAKPWPLPVLLIVALLPAALAYVLASGVMGVAGPLRFDSYGAALAVSLLPLALAFAVAGVIGWWAMRRRSKAS